MNILKSQYKRIILYNLLIAFLGLFLFVYNFHSDRQTPSEEKETETNPLRLAQLRVDFPILTIHDSHIVLQAFYFPKSRRFADQSIGVGMLYQVRNLNVGFHQLYRDLDPLSHAFSGYTDRNIDGKEYKVLEIDKPKLTSIAWFDDLGVYRLESQLPVNDLVPILMHIGRFTSSDEKTILTVAKIVEGKRFD